jgi:hypothetical protein
VLGVGIGMLVISLGAFLAGRGYIQAARRMQSFETTRGTVVERSLGRMSNFGGSMADPKFGKGGSYTVEVAYTYEVAGTSYRSDKLSYAQQGWRKSIAEQKLAAIPDQVEVHYNPAQPQEAYLKMHRPTGGYFLVGGGVVGMLLGLLFVLAA